MFSFASQNGDFKASFNLMAKLAAQFLVVLVHIHAAGHVHGDLKSDNVAVVEENGEYRIKLIDYDLAARTQMVRAYAGTRHTIAPEVVGAAAGALNEAADWWSYGTTLMWWASQIMQGLANHKNNRNEQTRWKKWRPMWWDHQQFLVDSPSMAHSLPPKLCCFLMSFLTDSPKTRKYNTKTEVLGLMKSSFFNDVDWNSIVMPRVRKDLQKNTVEFVRNADDYKDNQEIKDE